MTKYKVLSFVGYYLPGYKAGGVLRTLANAVEHLEEDIEFFIITRAHDQGEVETYQSIKKNQWNKVGAANVFYLEEDQLNIFSIFNILRKLDFDIYHFNSFFDPIFTFLPFIMRFFGLIKKAPIVMAPRGEFTPASLSEKTRLKSFLLRTFNLLSFPKNIVWQASSLIEANQIREVMQTSFDGIRISPDIPTTPIQFGKKTDHENQLELVYLSRIHPTKGTLEAFKIVSLLEQNVVFNVYGPIEDELYWQECLEIAGQFRASINFQYHGPIEYDQVSRVFADSDVFLFPSPGENYGHVVAESLLVGTPIVLSNNTPWEGFEEYGVGHIIPLSNLDQYAKEIDLYAKLSPVERISLRQKIIELAPTILKIPQSVAANREIFHHAVIWRSDKATQRTYQECTNCLMNTTDPFIRFNEEGLCDGCYNFYNNIKPNWKNSDSDIQNLSPKIKEIKEFGKDKKYDCIIGVSGGLDSSYLVYCVVKKLGLRPLLFHCDAGWNTAQAVWNIEKLVNGLNLDLYTHVIEWQEMRSLQLAFFESQIPDQDLPQDGAFFSALYKYAKKSGLRYVITGANYSTECCKEPMEWGGYPGIDKTLFSNILKRFGGFKLKTFPLVDILIYKVFYRIYYKIQVIRPLNSMRYIKKEAEETLRSELGWLPFPHKHHESRFTRFYEDYWMPQKFGYDRRRSHFSSLILTEQLTKAEAQERLSQPFLSGAELETEYQYIAQKLEISPSQLSKLFRKKNRTYRDYKNKHNLLMLGSVILRAIGLERRQIR